MRSFLRLRYLVLTVIVGLFGCGLVLFAQVPVWNGPQLAAPLGNVDVPINVGLFRQIKSGPLNIQMIPGSTGYKSSLVLPNWTTTLGMAIDTNGPISTNGVFTTLFQAASGVKFTSVPVTGAGALDRQPLCINKTTKVVEVCDMAVAPLPSLSAELTLVPSSLTVAGTVNVSLASTNVSKCVPAQGTGDFNFSQGETNGTWTVSNVEPLTTFTVICTGANNRTVLATAVVGKTDTPPVTLTLDSPAVQSMSGSVDYPPCDPSDPYNTGTCTSVTFPDPIIVQYTVGNASSCTHTTRLIKISGQPAGSFSQNYQNMFTMNFALSPTPLPYSDGSKSVTADAEDIYMNGQPTEHELKITCSNMTSSQSITVLVKHSF